MNTLFTQMAAQRRSSRSHSWSQLNRKQVLINFVLTMIVISLLLLVSAEVDLTIHHISTLQGRTEMQQGILKQRSRRILQIPERQAPRSFPPPQGNALVNNPRNAPPARAFFDSQNGRPAARIPDSAPRLVPPPHP